MSESFSVLNPPRPAEAKISDWPGLDGLGLALALASLARRQGGPVLVVASDGYSARQLRDDLKQLDAHRSSCSLTGKSCPTTSTRRTRTWYRADLIFSPGFPEWMRAS